MLLRTTKSWLPSAQLSTSTCSSSSNPHEVEFNCLLSHMSDDENLCVKQSPKAILHLLFNDSSLQQVPPVLSMRDDANQCQLVMDFTPLHNQSWDFTSVHEHYSEDHYLVNAIELVHGNLRTKRRYNQFRVHWYIPWLKTLLVSFLHLHKCNMVCSH